MLARRNRGLRFGIAAGYRYALDHGYAYCGRVDADGQHPARELKRLLALVRSDECDVAVGSRFVSGDGYAPYRYAPSPSRRFGTAVLRRAMARRARSAVRRRDERPVRGQREGAAAPRRAVHEPGAGGRGADPHHGSGLRLREVPVTMDERASGESKLRGSKAVKLVLTVAGTLIAARLVRARRR